MKYLALILAILALAACSKTGPSDECQYPYKPDPFTGACVDDGDDRVQAKPPVVPEPPKPKEPHPDKPYDWKDKWEDKKDEWEKKKRDHWKEHKKHHHDKWDRKRRDHHHRRWD